MNQEIKAQWVAALRSGEYEQGQLSLRNGNKYCCLGVLCDIAVKPLRLDVRKADCGLGDCESHRTYRYDGAEAFLPKSVMDWAGIGDPKGFLPEPMLYDGDLLSSLFSLNDSGMPFSEIADIIEEKF